MTHFARHIAIGLALALALASPHGAQAAKMLKIADSPDCIDGMETGPDGDDPEPIVVAAEDGCTVAPTVIST